MCMRIVESLSMSGVNMMNKATKIFDEVMNNCQNEYHKHFYEGKIYGRWTSSQLNTFYQDKLAELRRRLEDGV